MASSPQLSAQLSARHTASVVGMPRQAVASGAGGSASAPPAEGGAAAEAGIEDEDVALEVLLRKAAVMGVAEVDKPPRLREVSKWLDRCDGRMEDESLLVGQVGWENGRWESLSPG